jgi:putative phosphoribosyl transferase
MTFASREDAGRRLGHHLREGGVEAEVVAGLPRGGVVVAAEVARVLECPLQVLVVRKIGHPLHREFAVGAIAEAGVVVLDDRLIGSDPLLRLRLDAIIGEESERLQQYQLRFHSGAKSELAGRRVLLADDGLATGATMEAAVLSAREQGARQIVVAVPVASTNAVERLRQITDAVWTLETDPDFDAVGRYYSTFNQTSDEEVLVLLRGANTAEGTL